MAQEEVSAVLSVLWSLSRVHPAVRKYLRTTILPPLTAKDIQVRRNFFLNKKCHR